MKKLLNGLSTFRFTFFWRIAWSFLMILILIGVINAYFLLTTTRKYFDETTQRLNAGVAAHMLKEVQPFENGQINEESIGKIMHSMMAVNPGLEVYLTDPKGKILSYVVLEESVKLKSIAMTPVYEFLKSEGKTLVYGDDPKNPGEQQVFSVTGVQDSSGVLQGYVYMILVSEKAETIISGLGESFLLRMGMQYLALMTFSACLLGLLVMWVLTKNIRKIIKTVKEFEKGDFQARISIDTSTEIAALAKTFNSMADTILKNIDDLKQVDTLRRELVANVSHDIRTPISVIHGYVETLLIKKDSISVTEKEEYLRIILRNTERLKRLMADLFELSKLEAGQVTPKKEVFPLSDLLQDIALKYALLAREKDISLTFKPEAQQSTVCADVGLIERVIQNLIDNALKFTPYRGSVAIKMNNDAGNLEISVENTGEGIPEDKIPRIFDRYFKDHKNKSMEGVGLGLAIAKNILQIHGSDIRVASERFGKTSFSFSLPLFKS